MLSGMEGRRKWSDEMKLAIGCTSVKDGACRENMSFDVSRNAFTPVLIEFVAKD